MKTPGPPLESLTRRLAETPDDFLAEPRIGAQGTVVVGAVVGDLLRLLGENPGPEQLASFAGTNADDRPRLGLTLLLAWLLADPWFVEHRPPREALFVLLTEGARFAAATNPAKTFVTDPERREELVRLALAGLGLRPAGETMAEAADRLTTLSSDERARVIAAARAAEKRARQIREALARKAAEESADKWTRE